MKCSVCVKKYRYQIDRSIYDFDGNDDVEVHMGVLEDILAAGEKKGNRIWGECRCELR